MVHSLFFSGYRYILFKLCKSAGLLSVLKQAIGHCLNIVIAISFPAKDVTYLCPFTGPICGLLQLTNYRLHFKADDVSHELDIWKHLILISY